MTEQFGPLYLDATAINGIGIGTACAAVEAYSLSFTARCRLSSGRLIDEWPAEYRFDRTGAVTGPTPDVHEQTGDSKVTFQDGYTPPPLEQLLAAFLSAPRAGGDLVDFDFREALWERHDCETSPDMRHHASA